jgi:hypothetical protein
MMNAVGGTSIHYYKQLALPPVDWVRSGNDQAIGGALLVETPSRLAAWL